MSTARADRTLQAPSLNVSGYCADALEYLSHAYNQRLALFSWRSRLDADGKVVHDFDAPWSLRYTINTYLGLCEAERHGGPIEWLGPVAARVGEFLSAHETQIANVGDHGLLLVALAATDRSHPAVERSLARLERAVAHNDAAARLNMQELAWMLWGATSWSADARGQALARRIFDLIRREFVHPVTGMPRHSTRRYREHAVSFGSVVYFLRAMHEYDAACDSAQARALFGACVQRVLAIQGEDGAWPWMIDVRTAIPIDVYPIFSVHQDSMSMLFLLPAQGYGIAGVDAALQRSFQWNLGHNELDAQIVSHQPYAWFDRSIERRERWPRARRYLRGLGPRARRYPARSPHVRVNRECRSYHPGWVLYVWSARAER
ncbi:MAG: hypothetical protein ACLP1Q_07140 [Solirubrobacteraceae bacterium]